MALNDLLPFILGKQKKSQGNSAIITRTNFDQKAVFKDEKGVKLEYNGCVDTSYSSDEAVLRDYFQLSVNLSDLYKTWAQADPNFEKISKQFEGIRILRQEPIECLFAFICSSNNNISRISSMVEKLALHYGKKITEVDGIPYHAFPAVSALAGDGVEQKLRSLGFGYRAKYIQVRLLYHFIINLFLTDRCWQT